MVRVDEEKVRLTVQRRAKGPISDLYVNGQYAGMLVGSEGDAPAHLYLCHPERTLWILADEEVESPAHLRLLVADYVRAGLLLRSDEWIDATEPPELSEEAKAFGQELKSRLGLDEALPADPVEDDDDEFAVEVPPTPPAGQAPARL